MAKPTSRKLVCNRNWPIRKPRYAPIHYWRPVDCDERKLQRLLSRINEMQETALYLKRNRTPQQKSAYVASSTKWRTKQLHQHPRRVSQSAKQRSTTDFNYQWYWVSTSRTKHANARQNSDMVATSDAAEFRMGCWRYTTTFVTLPFKWYEVRVWRLREFYSSVDLLYRTVVRL